MDLVRDSSPGPGLTRGAAGADERGERAVTGPGCAEARSGFVADPANYGCSLIGPPIAFHAEWPPFMYLASNPASRSAMAVLHPT